MSYLEILIWKDDTFYLVNLSKKSWKKIDIPKEFRKNMEMHIVNTAKKILDHKF